FEEERVTPEIEFDAVNVVVLTGALDHLQEMIPHFRMSIVVCRPRKGERAKRAVPETLDQLSFSSLAPPAEERTQRVVRSRSAHPRPEALLKILACNIRLQQMKVVQLERRPVRYSRIHRAMNVVHPNGINELHYILVGEGN